MHRKSGSGWYVWLIILFGMVMIMIGLWFLTFATINCDPQPDQPPSVLVSILCWQRHQIEFTPEAMP